MMHRLFECVLFLFKFMRNDLNAFYFVGDMILNSARFNHFIIFVDFTVSFAHKPSRLEVPVIHPISSFVLCCWFLLYVFLRRTIWSQPLLEIQFKRELPRISKFQIRTLINQSTIHSSVLQCGKAIARSSPTIYQTIPNSTLLSQRLIIL